MSKDCTLSSKCGLANDSQKCKPLSCVKLINYNITIKKGGIPNKFTETKFRELSEGFPAQVKSQLDKYANNLYNHVKEGQGLFLFSTNTGTGKSTVATKLCEIYAQQSALKSTYIYKQPMIKFINVAIAIEELKKSFNRDGSIDYDNDYINDIEYALENSDLVVFDDLGVNADTEWLRTKIYAWINKRYELGKAVFITSNLNLQEISHKLGIRVADRIQETAMPVDFNQVPPKRFVNAWYNKNGGMR